MAFVATHDADRLGPLLAKPATPGGRGIELVSLADLVAFVASEMNWPRTAAAAHVADKLVAQIIPVDLLLTRPDGGFADVLGPEYAWRKAAPAQAGGVVGRVVQRRGFVQNYGGQSLQPQWVESRKPAKPAVVGIYGAAGALQCLRDAWGADDAGVRARAAQAFGATLQRLAMMRSVAHGLFGCGPALDDGQQRDGGRPPALDDNHMVGWPPAELEGLPSHDAQRWGRDRTQGGRPHEVIRVADLVYLVDRRGAGDVGESLAQVCEALARAKAVRWFVLVRGGAALPLTAGDLWQRTPGAVPAVGVARFFTTPDWFISAGLPPAEVQRVTHGMAPASRGLASLVDWLRAASFDQVDDGEFGALALPTLLAVELFGQAQEVSQLGEVAQGAASAVDSVASIGDRRRVVPNSEAVVMHWDKCNKDGKGAATKRTAAHFGITPRRVQAIKAAAASASASASATAAPSAKSAPWPGQLVQMGKRKTPGKQRA